MAQGGSGSNNRDSSAAEENWKGSEEAKGKDCSNSRCAKVVGWDTKVPCTQQFVQLYNEFSVRKLSKLLQLQTD